MHISAFVRCTPSEIPKCPRQLNKHHYIIVNKVYGHYFKYSDRRTTDRNQKVQWYLAKTLVHEIIHAYYARNLQCTDANENITIEPIMNPLHKVGGCGGDDSELGQESGYTLWGAYMQHIMHPTLAMFSEHQPLHFDSTGYNINPCLVISPTCPEWITSWLQEGKWVRLEKECAKCSQNLLDHEYKDFHVPQLQWATVCEKGEDEQPWMWTPRRSIMHDVRAQCISQNPNRRKCVEDYERKERAQVRHLRKLQDC